MSWTFYYLRQMGKRSYQGLSLLFDQDNTLSEGGDAQSGVRIQHGFQSKLDGFPIFADACHRSGKDLLRWYTFSG